ncbi:MAG: choice-of-anchor D domain-containing protein [Pseudomonadota bacterium]
MNFDDGTCENSSNTAIPSANNGFNLRYDEDDFALASFFNGTALGESFGDPPAGVTSFDIEVSQTSASGGCSAPVDSTPTPKGPALVSLDNCSNADVEAIYSVVTPSHNFSVRVRLTGVTDGGSYTFVSSEITGGTFGGGLSTINIVQDTVPDDGQDFSFTATGGLTPNSFSLDDDANGTLSNTRTFTDVAEGIYTVTQSANANYLQSVSCVDPSGKTTTGMGSATIDVENAEIVTCTFTNVPTAPELDISDSSGTITISDGETATNASAAKGTALGNVAVGANQSSTFTAQNTGTKALTFDADALSISNATDFSITSDLPNSGTLGAGNSTTFTIQFNPTSAGDKTTTVTINSDDADEDPYTFVVTGTGLGPELDVTNNAETEDIASGEGQSDATTTKGTDFGSIAVNTTTTTSFKAKNTGTVTLTLGADALALSNETDFSIITDLTNSGTILAPGTATFSIQFNPTSPGTKTSTVTIRSDDPDEDPYTFVITGTSLAPEIDIRDNTDSTDILSGEMAGDATTAKGTDFGTVLVASNATNSFRVKNTGSAALVFGADALAISNTTDFSITTDLTNSGTVNPTGNVTFSIQFSPQSAGTKTTTVTVRSNDANEDPYTFVITGQGVKPELQVAFDGNGNAITNGALAAAASTTNGTDYGSIVLGGNATNQFRVISSGSTNLTLGATALALSNTTDFFIVTDLIDNDTIPPSSLERFSIRFAPASTGMKTTTVTIRSDDSDDDPFTFVLVGNATVPEIDIRNDANDTSLLDGETAAMATAAKGTDFGNVLVGSNASSTFRVFNTGTSDLNFAADALSISDTTNFSITSDLTNSGSVAASAQATFTIQYNPAAVGAHSATVTVNSDDADENPFTFVIIGNGNLAPTVTAFERLTPTTETTDADSLIFRATFSEDVQNVDGADFDVTGTTATVTNVSPVSASVYDLTVSGGNLENLNAVVGLDLSSSSQDITDLPGAVLTNAEPPIDQTYIVQNDTISPTVEILNAPASNDGVTEFDITVQFSEAVTGFVQGDVAVINANTSGFTIVDASTYTVTLTPTGGGDITINIAAGAADDLAGNASEAATQVTVTSTVIGDTVQIITNLIENRARLILQNQPSVGRRLDRLNGVATNNGGISGFGLSVSSRNIPFALQIGENSSSFSYSTARANAKGNDTSYTADIQTLLGHANVDVADQKQAAETYVGNWQRHKAIISAPFEDSVSNTSSPQENFEDLAVAQNTLPAKASPIGVSDPNVSLDASQDVFVNRLDFWAEGSYSRFDAVGSTGSFGIVHAGADYLVSPNLLAGFGLQLDWTDINNATGSTADGFGYMAGPYVTARLSEQFYLDARLAYGKSSNSISPFGTFTDEFDATRWLATAALIGDFDFGQFNIQPQAKLSWFKETSDAYTDSLGNLVPSVSIETGTFEFGPTISTSFALDGGSVFSPFVSLNGIWSFAQNNSASALVSDPTTLANEGLRASVELGFDYALKRGVNISLSGYYDGFGDGSFEAYGISIGFETIW